MILQEAQAIAERIKEQLAPHCYRIEIAGSIRRQRPEVKDIEMVCIPKPWEIGMFLDGFGAEVAKYEKVLGDVENDTGVKYTKRKVPGGILMDLFIFNEDNWGSQLVIRTGSADFSKAMMSRMQRYGLKHEGGYVIRQGKMISVGSEEQFFRLVGMTYIDPVNRNTEYLSTLK